MALPGRAYRVFVSSTFSDLATERDILQRDVFPRLQMLCQQLGARFQAVDLRWGVSEEASLDHQTMDICLSEIERCQRVSPHINFLVLLGDRYGSRPLPARIPADEFEALCGQLIESERDRLGQWYRCDENARQPEYCLLSAVDKYLDYTAWQPVERELRGLLMTGMRRLVPGIYDPAHYSASATEQEIVEGVLKLDNAPEQVHCFFRTITNLDELLTDVTRTRGAPPGKRAVDFVDLNEQESLNGQESLDGEARTQLESLKARLRARLPVSHIHEYEAQWMGEGITTEHIAQLCQAIYDTFAAMIEVDLARENAVPPVEREGHAHTDFGAERRKHFIGRTDALGKIASYLAVDSLSPLLVVGASGIGKSALMAEVRHHARQAHPSAVVVERYIGATPSSTDLRSLLLSLCRQVARAYGGSDGTIPVDVDSLKRRFFELLMLATPARPLLLFIDALDQLGQSGLPPDMSWLPRELPEHVWMVVSAIMDGGLAALEQRVGSDHVLDLQDMSLREGGELLSAWLREAKRTLQPAQREEVLRQFDLDRRPLYLKLAFEEARRWKSYTPKSKTTLTAGTEGIIRQLLDRLASPTGHGRQLVSHGLGYLGAAKEGLAEAELLDVLSRDSTVMAEFRSRTPRSPDTLGRLPTVIWSRLYFDLEPYLAERNAEGGPLLTFYHRQLAQVVTATYLQGTDGYERHQAMAHYFMPDERHVGQDRRPMYSQRGLEELPYQLTEGQSWDELYALLTDFAFLEQKAATGLEARASPDGTPMRTYTGIYLLQDDFTFALTRVQQYRPRDTFNDRPGPTPSGGNESNAREQWEALGSLEQVITRETHAIAEHPEILFQQCFNRLQWVTGPAEHALQALLRRGEEAISRPWLRGLTQPRESASLTRELAMQADTRNLGRVPLPILQSVFDTEGRRVAARSEVLLRVWELISGRMLVELQSDKWLFGAFLPDNGGFVTLEVEWTKIKPPPGEKHTRYLVGKRWDSDTWQAHVIWRERIEDQIIELAALSPNGAILVAATHAQLWVWNLATGGPMRSYYEEALLEAAGSVEQLPWVMAFAFEPSSRFLLVADNYGFVCWDTATWTASRPLAQPHWDSTTACVWTPDSAHVAIGHSSGAVEIRNVSSGQEELWFSGGDSAVLAIACSPDGRLLATGGANGSVQVWERSSGRELRRLVGHKAGVPACAFSPNGRLLLTGGKDGRMLVWDLDRPPEVGTLDRHSDDVTACAFAPNGDSFATGSKDRTARVWDTQDGHSLAVLEGHSAWLGVSAITYNPDGAHLITGDGDANLRAWDAATGARLWTRPHSPPPPEACLSCAYSPDGALLACCNDYRVQIRHTGNLSLPTITICPPDLEEPGACVFTPDGTQLIIGGRRLHVWDRMTAELRSFEIKHFTNTAVRSLAMSPTGEFVIAATRPRVRGHIGNSDVWLLNLAHFETRLLLSCLPEWAWACAVTPGGETAVVLGENGTLWFLDPQIGAQKALLRGPAPAYCLALHPTLPKVVVGGQGGNLDIFELRGVTYDAPVTVLFDSGGRSVVRCPWCRHESEATHHLVGELSICPMPDCNGGYRVVSPHTSASSANADAQASIPSTSPVPTAWWRSWLKHLGIRK